jgi:hypothetical protein
MFTAAGHTWADNTIYEQEGSREPRSWITRIQNEPEFWIAITKLKSREHYVIFTKQGLQPTEIPKSEHPSIAAQAAINIIGRQIHQLTLRIMFPIQAVSDSTLSRPATNASLLLIKNSFMMEWSRNWMIDGDLCRCRLCKRAIVLSRSEEAMIHAAGCKNHHLTSPWQDLHSMTSTPAASPQNS